MLGRLRHLMFVTRQSSKMPNRYALRTDTFSGLASATTVCPPGSPPPFVVAFSLHRKIQRCCARMTSMSSPEVVRCTIHRSLTARGVGAYKLALCRHVRLSEAGWKQSIKGARDREATRLKEKSACQARGASILKLQVPACSRP